MVYLNKKNFTTHKYGFDYYVKSNICQWPFLCDTKIQNTQFNL